MHASVMLGALETKAILQLHNLANCHITQKNTHLFPVVQYTRVTDCTFFLAHTHRALRLGAWSCCLGSLTGCRFCQEIECNLKFTDAPYAAFCVATWR